MEHLEDYPNYSFEDQVDPNCCAEGEHGLKLEDGIRVEDELCEFC